MLRNSIDKDEVKAWAAVITAVLGVVYAAEKVIEKGCSLFGMLKPHKNTTRASSSEAPHQSL